jgi:hypothetical protein
VIFFATKKVFTKFETKYSSLYSFRFVFTVSLILVLIHLSLKFHVLQSVFDKVTALQDATIFASDFFATKKDVTKFETKYSSLYSFRFVFTVSLILVYRRLNLKLHVLRRVFDKVTAFVRCNHFPGDIFVTKKDVTKF